MGNARRLFVAVMGAWMGLAGIEHGVGEILQGNIAPDGLMILSWPEAPFFRSLGGEPALTILPNLRLTGILAVFFSLLFAGWAIGFASRKCGGLVLMLFTIPMLLFGGGIFPPILGVLIGAAATGLHGQQGMVKVPAGGLRRLLGLGWPRIFIACCLAWLALFPGVPALDYFFGLDEVGVILSIIAAALILLLLSYWSAIQHDRMHGTAQVS